jgi:hypothetical protein
MRTVLVSPHDRSINALLAQAEKENLIVRSPDGREFILAEMDDFDREIELTRQNQSFMEFLDRRARESGAIPLDQVEAALGEE